MVTVQDIGLQLTKSVKELAEWNYPFSETLETYYTLFEETYNKSFGEAGLVVQNSTAVYVRRLDCLWSKTEYFRNIFSSCEQEETTKNSIKRKERKINANFQDFKTVNFAAEVDKNIDIKKNYTMQDCVKPKSRRFTQLEKSFAQSVPIDIYDVNGEIIGKKYDFRCNQNININGILVDEFAPQDFCSADNDFIREKSPSTNMDRSHVSESLECLSSTLAEDSFVHDNSNCESEGNCDDSPLEMSNLTTSFELDQNISLSEDNNTAMLTDTPADVSNDNFHHLTSINIDSEMQMNTPSDSKCNSTTVDSTIVLNNSHLDSICSNSNDSKTVDDDNLYDNLHDSSLGSLNPQRKRALSTDDLTLLDDTISNRIQDTPVSSRKKRLISKSTSKLRKKSLIVKKKESVTKNLLKEFRKKDVLEKSKSPQTGRPNMFQENLSTCTKYIQQYDSLQYDDVMNAELDFLGFQLRVTATDTSTNDNASTTSTDDRTSELHSPSPASSSREDFCKGTLFGRSKSPSSLPENVERWHELIQPKLREAEHRPSFNLKHYKSLIIQSLKSSNQQQIRFNDIIGKEPPWMVPRYFLASLDLASQRNVDIIPDKSLENNIEIVLSEKDGQSL